MQHSNKREDASAVLEETAFTAGAESGLKKVLIMAGGTGGHIFPGLALAAYLKARGVEVAWLGTKQGLEARLVPEANIPLRFITISGLRGKHWRTLITAPFKLLAAIKQSLSIIKDFQPDVVVGMGGFVSGPGGMASWLVRRPLLIHEQNAKAGWTNQLLRRIAWRVLEGLPGAFPEKHQPVFVGNPVREAILTLPAPSLRLKAVTPFRLLILGGSLGARPLNEIVPQALAQLDPAERPIITHQTGEKWLAETKSLYEKVGVNANVVSFIKEMAHAYQEADMVLCRAGALTIAELCAVGVGAILVPYPFAVDDHQTANAEWMVKQGAAICIQQSALSITDLAVILKDFTAHPHRRLAMAEAAYQLRQAAAVEKMFHILCEITKDRQCVTK